ncbi:MAG: pentapeptide repeat-containing protein [Cyanobacteria bacterium P01_D01_bin.105]
MAVIVNWQQRIVKCAILSAILSLAVGLVWLSSPVLAGSMPVNSAVARIQAADREVLSLPLLETRLNAPVQASGALVVNLSGLVVDLRGETPESAAFAEAFYQKLQQRLNEKQPNGKQAIGLDLSGALVKGELDLTRLSLRVPAYSSVSIPALEAFNTKFGTSLSTQTDAFAFQGPLWLRQTCFTSVFQADNLYFLGPVDAEQAIFTQLAHWRTARFARSANFSQAQFQQESSFRSAVFTGRTRFNNAVFSGSTNWQSATFDGSAQFSEASFQSANFARSHWFTDAAFSQASFHAPLTFQKSHFEQALFFSEAQFESAVNFRQVKLQAPIHLRGALIRNQLDFGDARFGAGSRINVADLDFNAGEARILGSPGQLGPLFSVPSLANNEAVLQNLVRNFRLLEQIADANQVEYTAQRLRLAQIRREFPGLLLSSLLLSGLLLLSDYGTNVTLVFSVGVMATTLFGLMFWLVDRYRRRVPAAIVPAQGETIWVLLGGSVSLAIAAGLLSQCQHPFPTLMAVSTVTLPLPGLLIVRLYQQGRYHDLMEVSYFVKNGALRSLQVLIARLPIIPQYPFYRDRYQPLLTDRRWSWLNYYDFSLNNWFKFGFNDIRLRDKAVPGIVCALVWYQWGLGISYITLLLWTLSRTIPGLNLLLYF